MSIFTALLVGIAGSLTGAPLVAYLKHRFDKSASRTEYRKQRIEEWKKMVNQTRDSYPITHFTNFDQYPSLAEFLNESDKSKVESLNLGSHPRGTHVGTLLANSDEEFMAVFRMLKSEISRVEREMWNLI